MICFVPTSKFELRHSGNRDAILPALRIIRPVEVKDYIGAARWMLARGMVPAEASLEECMIAVGEAQAADARG